ncbi:hypothetical protein L0337_44660 [candidate division KSB1 bacterium]|nr:hypothetical protein [candidate division KSB1 bacterium]
MNPQIAKKVLAMFTEIIALQADYALIEREKENSQFIGLRDYWSNESRTIQYSIHPTRCNVSNEVWHPAEKCRSLDI